MKIAIPVFNTRISPRFDCAKKFLVVSLGSDSVDQQELAADTWSPLERVHKLKEWGVNILICGGIDRFSERLLNCFENLMVYSWVTGEAQDALTCFLKGKMESGLMIGEGGNRSGRWEFKSGHQRRRGRGHRWKKRSGPQKAGHRQGQ
jgi:predicted Fe-Mo cluster-binding NifX family protein